MKNVVSVTEGRPTYVPWYKAILRGLKPGGSIKGRRVKVVAKKYILVGPLQQCGLQQRK
jgi:hypothetical protein